MNLRQDHPALKSGRTIFLKSVTEPKAAKRLLQPASTNRKLGGGKMEIRKGRWKGMQMYQLVLEERETCPRTCQEWGKCYGNNMYMAKRINARSADFLPMLESELSALSLKHSTEGFVIRLHVLGDFYSKTYVNFWIKALSTYPNLRLFGYTHRMPEHKDGIGKAVERLNAAGAFIRFSDRGGLMSANVDGEGLRCPHETGKTASCLTCGLCWNSDQPIMFTSH